MTNEPTPPPERLEQLDAAAELALVSFAARLLLSQPDARLLLERGLETFLDFARGTSGAVFLLAPGSQALRLAAGGVVTGEGPGELVVEASASPWSDALASGRPTSFPLGALAGAPCPLVATLDPGAPAAATATAPVPVPVRECLCVPLHGSANRIVGLVTIARARADRLDGCRLQSLNVLQSILALGLEQAAARERLLEANEELEALHRAKTKMIDHLSHELKTPLAVIGASAELLARPRLRRDDERAGPVLDRIRRALERLLELQEEASDIAEAVRGEVAASSIALERWVPEVLSEIAPLHRHRRVRVETELETVPAILLPEPLLRKSLIGLVRNAIEATPDGGWVRLAIARRQRAAQHRGAAAGRAPGTNEAAADVVLEVVDSGVGLDEAARRQLFHGFVHAGDTADYSTGRPYDAGAGGRGLDLLRTRHFADRHGITIEVESEPGRGSRFRLVLPPELHVAPPSAPATIEGGARADRPASGPAPAVARRDPP